MRNYGRELTDKEKRLRGEAAALIRKYFWRGTEPPLSPDDKPWTMGRELNIWTILVVRGGRNPEALNGAIEVACRVRPDITEPMRMTYFYHHGSENGPGGTVLLERCIAYWHAHDTRKLTKKGLPPTIKATLQRMVQ